MDNTQRFRLLCVAITVIGVMYVLDDRYNKAPVLERPLGKKQKRRTYAEFVAIAKVDHKAIIGIPWVQLPDLDGYIPTYLKYKEQLLTEPVNQGGCASCWSISVVQMLSDRISVYTGGRVKKTFSIQEMISCWDGHGGKACSKGGIPELAYKYIIENGIGLSKDYRYEQERTNKIKECDRSKLNGERWYVQPGSVRSLCIDPYMYREGSTEYDNTIRMNIKNMKKELLVNGPFVSTIMVHQNLYAHDGLSIYEGHNDTEFVGGHAITCIGWCEEGINGVEKGFDLPYWILRNSWSDWPSKSPASEGYFYIKMGSNVCGIESRASRAFPVLTDEAKSNMVKSLDESRYTTVGEWVDDPERRNYITKVGKLRGWLK